MNIKNQQLLWALVLAVFLIPTSSNAQFGLGKLKKKKEKVEKAIKKKKKQSGVVLGDDQGISNQGNGVIPNIVADKPHNGISSPMHEKYMGQVVFGSSMAAIEFEQEQENQFITEANWGEEIRLRVYMDNSLVNYLKTQNLSETHGTFKFKFYLDGNEIGERNYDVKYFDRKQKTNYTTFRAALKSLTKERSTFEGMFNRVMIENESLFTPGAHQLKIEVLPYQSYPQTFIGPVVSTGEITLNFTKSLVDPDDEEICLPKAKMKDTTLEAKILEAFKEQGWSESPIEVRIISSKWNIKRHKYSGVIQSRFVEAVIGSTKDGQCAYQDFNFYQDHDGSDFQSEVYLSGIGSKSNVSCGCMK